MRGYESSARIRPAWAAAPAASPGILSSRRALAITGSWGGFLHGGGSFRPLPAIACCAHAARDTSRTTPASHPPQVPRCARKDPRISLPVPCPSRSGNPRLLLLCGLISGEFVRLTPVPLAMLPPRRSRLPAGRMPHGLPLWYRSYSLLSRRKRSPSELSALSVPSAARRFRNLQPHHRASIECVLPPPQLVCNSTTGSPSTWSPPLTGRSTVAVGQTRPPGSRRRLRPSPTSTQGSCTRPCFPTKSTMHQRLSRC